MKPDTKILKGWRRGGNAIRPQTKPIAKPEPVTIKEVPNVVQPDAKSEERETKNKKGKKEKVVELVAFEEVLSEPEPKVSEELTEEGEIKDGND